jgi:flagellar M-ring protein FliF
VEDNVQQIKTVWAGLEKRKQVVAILAGLAMVVSILAISRMAASPTMKLLYAGLENGAAGDVIRVLEQQGTKYEVRGGALYVPARERDELRMTLAAEGLPANSGRGYELLDSLSGFGTTSQMFDAAYWRAKEGELARTIVASPHISQARVHIANSGSNPFRQRTDPSASVTVTATGAPITPEQANALRYLVASAVAGMAVEKVAIIDARGILIGAGDSVTSAATAEDRSQVLRERVLRLVEAHVGAGNAYVEVSVDTVTATETIRETRFDPEGRVAISVDTEERSDSSRNQAGGDVTVASNLPDGNGAANDGSSARTSETRERINYEVSETQREILRAPGAVKRLTVAVLVNGAPTEGADGKTVFQPRPEDELNALRALIAAAVGFDDQRGDVITLKSMDLPSANPLGTVASTSFLGASQLDVMSLAQMAVLALVALVLGLFVVRPILANSPRLPPSQRMNLPLPASGTPVLTGEISDAQPVQLGSDAQVSGPGDMESPVDRLRSMIGEKQEETVEILRSWLEESEEKAQ